MANALLNLFETLEFDVDDRCFHAPLTLLLQVFQADEVGEAINPARLGQFAGVLPRTASRWLEQMTARGIVQASKDKETPPTVKLSYDGQELVRSALVAVYRAV